MPDSKPSVRSPRSRLAELLRTRREEVVRRWTGTVRDALAERMGRPALVDSIPLFLDALVVELERASVEGEPRLTGRALAIAGAHGIQRAGTPVDLPQLLLEYTILRRVILSVAKDAGVTPALHEVRVLADLLEAGVAEAATRFVEERAALLRRSEEQFQALADHAPAAIFTKAADGRFQFANRFLCELLGRPREEVLGRSDRELLAPADAARMEAGDARARAGETVELREEATTTRGRRTFFTVKFPLADDGRDEPSVGAIGVDVTELEEAQRERAETLALLEGILATAPVGLSFVDQELRFVRVNAALSRMSGAPVERTVGRTIREVLPALAPELEPRYRHVLETGEPILDVEVSGATAGTPDGHWLVSHFPIRDAGGRVIMAGSVVVDITERKRTERRLQQASEFEQQLVGIVSHDLRNPLNAVLLGASALLSREDLPERHVPAVARIRAAGERATRMIRDLLDLTRARLGGGIPVQPRDADLAEVATQVLEELRTSFPDRELVLETRGSTAGRWDPDRLAQVVGNLATNALKYSPAGTPVRVSLRGAGEEVRLEVRNAGDPIPPGKRATLFEPWERGVHPVQPGDRSIGLGLYIVDRLVAAHGGRVEVESTADRGTTFTVVLPRSSRAP